MRTRPRLGLALALALVGCKETPPPASPASPASAVASGATAAPVTVTPPSLTVAPASPEPAPALAFRAPAITRSLSAAHTVAVIGVEGLDGLFRVVARAQRALLPKAPASLRAEWPEGIERPGWLTQQLGFPPNTPSGWQNVGLHPAAGLAMVFDDRLIDSDGPVPLLTLQVADRGKALHWLSGLDRAFGAGDGVGLTGEKTGACEHLAWGSKRACLANRRGFVVFMPLPEGRADRHPALMTAFDAIVGDAGPALADQPRFRRTLAGYQRAPAAYAYVDHQRLLHVAQAHGMRGNAETTFALDRFPATGLVVSAAHTGLRVLADSAGAEALRQIVVPAGPAPIEAYARLSSPTGGALATTINVGELFDGVVALIPPSRGDLKGQVLIAKNMLPTALGVSLDDLAGAFSGRALVVFERDDPDLEAMRAGSILALGLRGAPATTQATLGRLLERGKKTLPQLARATRGEIAGRPAFTLVPGKVLAVVDGDQLLIGAPPALHRVLQRKGAGLRTLAEAHLVGVAVSRALVEALPIPGEPSENAFALEVFHYLLGSDTFDFGFAVDDRGLRADGRGALLAGLSVVAIGIPAFVKYMARARAAQGAAEVATLTRAAATRHAAGSPLTSIPLTPAADPCAEGQPHYHPSADTFAAFGALGFSPEGKQYFRYQLDVDAQGFTARAVGDLDCDGAATTFTQIGRLEAGEITLSGIQEAPPRK